MLYIAIRIIEGLIIIALEVRPLGSLRVISRVFFSDLTLEPLQYLIRSLFAFHL